MAVESGASGLEGPPPSGQAMGDLTWQHDWSSTPLGPVDAWPPCLRTTVDIMLAAGHAMCLMWGPERIFLYNDAYAPMLGLRHPAALGRPAASVWTDIWTEIEPIVERTFRGETSAFEELPLTMTRHGFDEPTWWDFCYSPVRDEAGRVAGLLNVTMESTTRVVGQRQLEQARERQELLNAELAHRIKNTMSVVQAIATQTLGKVVEPAAMRAFGDRLGALTASHDLLTRQSWSTAPLDEIVHAALATFGEERFVLDGPSIEFGARATLALSLMLHELATNAVKYGALSVPDGRVRLTWHLTQGDREPSLKLIWREEGGPPAVEPQRRGFGSRIIGMGLSGSGGVKLHYDTTGLTLEADAPLSHVQEA
jgi:two-component sensor histidine kinase